MTARVNAQEAAPRRGSLHTGGLFDLTLRQIERALRERTRYRYVSPRVLREGQGFRIESPCCSRNVDTTGGVIDIAWLTRDEDGVELANAQLAIERARSEARTMAIASIAEHGHLILHHKVIVADADGVTIAEVRFGDVIEVRE